MARFVSPHGKNRGGRIQPRESGTGSTDGLTPVFCLRYLAPPFCVTNCERQEQAAFAVTLKRLSTMTWTQIRNSPRHGLGSEKIGRAAIRAPIPGGITDDVDFIAIRFNSLAPMVGFRSNQVFHVVWLDRAYTLYAH
ncbi:MAG TPA: hypothetical protein VEX86_14480 [Longimicrobium sp.]|nr:hypothetical protein [Longimicrobium sp.]